MFTNKNAAAAFRMKAAAAPQFDENQAFTAWELYDAAAAAENDAAEAAFYKEERTPGGRFLRALLFVGFWTYQILPFAIAAAVLFGGLFLITL